MIELVKTNQNFVLYKNSYREVKFNLEGIGDVSGAEIKWKLAPSWNASPSIIKTTDDDISINEDHFVVYIYPEETEGLKLQNYYHEARVTDQSGRTVPVAIGKVKIEPTLTLP